MTITELINHLLDQRAVVGNLEVEVNSGPDEDYRVIDSVTANTDTFDGAPASLLINLGRTIGG